MSQVKLSPSYISSNLQCPPGKKRVEICDIDLPGLYIEVRAASQGQGTFYYRYKDNAGKSCHQKIGRTGDISLADARTKARELKAEITLGADPRGEAKAQRAVLTVSEFFEEHYLPHAKPRKRSYARDFEMYHLRIKAAFGSVRLNEVTRKQVQHFHTRIREEGLAPATADHYIKLMRRAWNLAVEWEMLASSPITKLALFNQDNRVEHYVSEDQLAALITVLRTQPIKTVSFVALFLLSTGARLNEALQAKWKDIDRVNRVWRIPATNSKSKRVRSVPLNDTALEVLSQQTTEDTFEFVFINRHTKLPLTTVHKVWGRLRTQAGLPHLRIHDLRHQYASFLVNSGRTLFEVQNILGHSDPKVTQRYSHLSSKSLQEAANSASIIIQGAMPDKAVA